MGNSGRLSLVLLQYLNVIFNFFEVEVFHRLSQVNFIVRENFRKLLKIAMENVIPHIVRNFRGRNLKEERFKKLTTDTCCNYIISVSFKILEFVIICIGFDELSDQRRKNTKERYGPN